MKKLVRITTVPISLDKLLGKQLSHMAQYFDLTAVSTDEKELKRVAEKYGVKNHPVEMTREITPLKDLKAVWKFYRFLKKEKPHVVHSHTPKAGLVGMMAAYFARVPVRMHTVAGLPLLEAKGFKRFLLHEVEKITYAFATHVYPNSFELQRIIEVNRFCPPGKLKVIGNGSSNGIDLEYFHPEAISQTEKETLRQELGLHDQDFIFVFVGRLVTDKGINELVDAFQKLTENTSGARTPKLLLVGPLEEQLDPLRPETAKAMAENPHILSVGYQDDVRPYFAISEALVFPSYREGFPNVVLQAGAMGLPAIVTDINGCNEIIQNGKNGIVIPTKNSAALQEAIITVLNDSLFTQKMRENAQPTIAARYSQSLLWEELRKEYERLLGGSDQ